MEVAFISQESEFPTGVFLFFYNWVEEWIELKNLAQRQIPLLLRKGRQTKLIHLCFMFYMLLYLGRIHRLLDFPALKIIKICLSLNCTGMFFPIAIVIKSTHLTYEQDELLFFFPHRTSHHDLWLTHYFLFYTKNNILASSVLIVFLLFCFKWFPIGLVNTVNMF